MPGICAAGKKVSVKVSPVFVKENLDTASCANLFTLINFGAGLY